MLYLFYGNDIGKTKSRRDSFLKQLFAKKPNASFFEYDAERFSVQWVEELLLGQGLFEREHVVLLRGALALPETREYVEKNMKLFAGSPNVFIFIEQKLDTPLVAVFETHAKKIWKSESKKQSAEKPFNPFALGDAFACRDRRGAWALFSRAVYTEGVEPEFAHGIIFSQVKNMLLVKREEKNPGLHPFV